MNRIASQGSVAGSLADAGENPAVRLPLEGLEPLRRQRTCLLVLGMHRSGTSAVCGVLHELGAERPIREIPPLPENEKGFFESLAISAIHDRLLESAGLYWFDWEPMSASWFNSASYEQFLDELVEAVRIDYPGKGTFLLKDPRICRFAEIWLTALDRLDVHPVVILQYRHPVEVAQSLKVRNGLSLAHGLLLWLRHVIDAERSSRKAERSFVNFTNLMIDWQAELSLTLENGKVLLPKKSARARAAAEAFLDDTLRHHTKPNLARDSIHNWVLETFDALEQLRADPHNPTAMATLDSVRDRFDTASAAFTPAFQSLLLRVDHLERDATRATALDLALSAAKQTIASLAPVADRVPAIEAALEGTRQALAASDAVAGRVPGLANELIETRQALLSAQDVADRVPALEVELIETRRALAALQQSVERIPGLEAELNDAKRDQQDLRYAHDAAISKLDRTIGARLAAMARINRSS